jgi:protein gp37
MSNIEWTEQTWNPVTGCTRVSAGCDHCYAVQMTKRLGAMGKKKYEGLVNDGKQHFNGVVKMHEHTLVEPLKRKVPTLYFVNSMSDLFHPSVSEEFIAQVFETMQEANWHTFQILTKRPERAATLSARLPWPGNVWLGTTVEDERVKGRISDLRRTGAQIAFLSCEPLIGPLSRLPFSGIDWVITGGESGSKARPMDPDWVRGIRDRCVKYGVPYFFKQWGTIANNPDPQDPTAKKNGGTAKGGRMLDGRTWDEMPERVQKTSVG